MIGLLLMAAQASAATPAPPPTDAPSAAPPAHVGHAPGDPLEGFNRKMYKIQDGLDHAVLRPAAMGYKSVVPRFLRTAIRNFFSNLGEPVVFANFVLQHKIGKAAETFARFAANSTLGLAGTIDVASQGQKNLPHRPNSFGDTMGFYGVKPGPYLFIPLMGPSTLRDLAGGSADGLLLPVAVGKPFGQLRYEIPKAVVTGLDLRAEHDGDMRALLGTALDPYATLRSVYLQDRAGEIAGLKGTSVDDDVAPAGDALTDPMADPAQAKPPASAAPELQDPLADPAAPTPPPAPAPPAPAPDVAAPAAPAQK